MLEMLNKMWIGATCRLHNFVEDFKHEEKGAAEIVAIILVIVVVIAVVVVFRERIMDLVSNTFDDADKVKDTSFLEIGNLKNTSVNQQKQRGAIMVEAALYFPITIAVVMAVIYLGLFKMQESYFFFQVERTAAQLAKEIAYPGYEGFTDKEPLSDGKVDFSWEEPSDEQVQSYYEAYNGSLTKIYRLGAGSNTKERLAKYQESLCKYSTLLSVGTAKASIRVENKFMSQSVFAELRYELPTPGILRYLGMKDTISLYAAAYQPVLNTTDFVRNVDLAWDLGKFFLDKLGIDTDKFVENFNKVKEIIF